MNCFSYAWGIIANPVKTIRRLNDDPKRLLYGFFGVLTLGVLYAATALILWSRGIGVESNWIRIPCEQHYLWQGFFNLPVSIAGGLLTSSVIYLIMPRNTRNTANTCKKSFSEFLDNDKFDDVLAAVGLPYGILVLPLMWLPETLVAIFWPSLWTTPVWKIVSLFRVGFGSLWVLMSIIIAVKETCKPSWARAVFVGLVGMIAGLALSIVFIR
ncbi:hypothetical protein GX441_05175 [bacterium]|nr:hypothetical protein [bacterium]